MCVAATEVSPSPPGINNLRKLIQDVPDFPSPGILFRDITPLLADPAGLALAVEYLAQPFRGKGIEAVVGVESRGFVFGAAVAQSLSVGFVLVRKPGKLPGKVTHCDFNLEYGSDALEIKVDALAAGQRVVIIDDLLATGGTLAACCELVSGLGAAIVGVSVLIELVDLNGRRRLSNYTTTSVLRY